MELPAASTLPLAHDLRPKLPLLDQSNLEESEMKKITVLLAFGLCCGTTQAQFGTGADGALTVTGAESLDVSHAVLFNTAPAGSTTLGIYDYAGVSSSPPFSV